MTPLWVYSVDTAPLTTFARCPTVPAKAAGDPIMGEAVGTLTAEEIPNVAAVAELRF